MRIGIVIFTALTVSLISAPRPSPSNQKSPNPAQSKTQTNTQPSESSKKSLAPPAYSPSKEKPSANTTDQNGKAVTPTPNERAIRIVSYPPRSAGETIALWCTVLLTIAAVIGIVVAVCTLRNIGKQTRATVIAAKATQRSARATQISAEATRDSVELQKTLKRQWVNLEKWNISGENIQSGKSTTTIRLFFDVVNPTDMPLTLKHIEIFKDGGTKILSPNKPLAPTKSHSVYFEINLSEQETACYFNNWLRLHIFGTIAFRDNFGERRNQIFGHVCAGGATGLSLVNLKAG